MSYPILYDSETTDFGNNGIGILSGCVSCEVVEEANGAFELTMKYPMDGIHYENIVDRCIIKAKSNNTSNPQLFRVYSISKPMSGIVTVLAQHISYDLSGIPVSPFTAENASGAMRGIKENALYDCPFTFSTDKSTVAKFSAPIPGSIRSKLGGIQGSILDVYGGEYEFDNFNVILHHSRGRNNGVSIRYGKNLTDIRQDRNCSAIATGIYPYWAGEIDGDQVFVELPEKVINAPGTYNFIKIKTVDLSAEFMEKPTVEDLRSRAESYIKNNEIGIPYVSLSVSFASLEQSEEYKHLKLFEKVNLFDTVNVEFPALNVSATAKAVKIVYDCIANRVKNVTLGSVRSNIADTLADQQQQIQQTPSREELRQASAAATAWLTNGKGYKIERRDENGNTIDTLYMDTPDITKAKNILRIGQSGIGFSRNGVDGPYYSAWTLDGTFDASVINVINLIANKVYAVTGLNSLEVSGANLIYTYKEDMLNQSLETILMNNSSGGQPSLKMNLWKHSEGENSIVDVSWLSPNSLKMGGTDSDVLCLYAHDGAAGLAINGELAKYLSWEYSNELGKYVLCGE